MNANLDTIYNEFNGNISAANLASNAVTTAKIADSNVTTAKLADSNVTTAKINDGAVTPAKWTNPYCFRAYPSSGTTIADGANTKILFQTEDYDYNNNFASSTYTAPVAGVYHFNGRVGFATTIASGVLAYLVLYVNGAETIYGNALSTAYTTASAFVISGDIKLNANDTVELWMYQDSGGTEATQASSVAVWFAGHLVHKV